MKIIKSLKNLKKGFLKIKTERITNVAAAEVYGLISFFIITNATHNTFTKINANTEISFNFVIKVSLNKSRCYNKIN